MTKKKLLFITIASNRFGYGHLNRCKNFSKYIKKNCNYKFIIFTDEKINKSIKFKNLNDSEFLIKNKNLEKFDKILIDLTHPFILKKEKFIDNLSKFTRLYKTKITIIDGLGKEMINKINKIQCKNLICPYFVPKTIRIKKKKNVNYLIGAKYAIIPDDYKFINKIKYKYTSVLISCGGADINSNTLIISNFLLKINNQIKLNIVIGPYFKKNLINKIKKLKRKNVKHITLYEKIKNLTIPISRSNLAFISSGLTKYEIASVGLPCVVFCENKSQLKLNEGYRNKKISYNIGLIGNLNKHRTKIINLINKKKLLKSFSKKSKKNVDFNGLKRISNYIFSA